MLRAVTFDFWNTIAQVPPGAMEEARRRAVGAACEACEAEVDAELLSGALEEIRLRWERSWAEGVHMHPGEGAEMLVGALDLAGEARRTVADAFLGALRGAPLLLAGEIGECLEALGRRGLRIGIVCDVGFSGGEVLRGLLDREGLLDSFDGWAFSDEVGHYKPAPQIFEAALRELDAQPAETLHVGDLRRTDVAGAAALGMRTIRYRGMHDDPEHRERLEADFVLDSHAELLDVLELIEREAA